MINKKPKDFLKEAYARVLVPETGGGYYAEILEFPGCYASGETADEAFKNLEEVALLWVESELEEGHEIPPPTSPQEYSGKFALRLPRTLHQQAARFAQREGSSLNQFIVSAIAEKVGALNFFSRMVQSFEEQGAKLMSLCQLKMPQVRPLKNIIALGGVNVPGNLVYNATDYGMKVETNKVARMESYSFSGGQHVG